MGKVERSIVLGVFLSIILATFSASILVGLGLFENADPGLFKWLIGTGIVEILGVVIWAYKESARPSDNISVEVLFPDRAPEDSIVLDPDHCTYELLTVEGDKPKHKDNLTPTALKDGEWRCELKLPPSANTMDYLKLKLIDRGGDEWQVTRFRLLPLGRKVNASRANTT
jgi:hypothetical protein